MYIKYKQHRELHARTHHPDGQLMLEVVILRVKGHFFSLLQLAACEIIKHKHVLRMHGPATLQHEEF